MAIVGRTATVSEQSSAQTVTGNLAGVGAQAGDYVIAFFASTGTVAAFTGPGGSWTALAGPANSSDSALVVALYGQFSPGSAPTISTTAAASRHTCIMQAYGGVDATTPVDVAAQTAATNLPLTIPSVTTVTAGARMLSVAGANFSSSAWTSTPATSEGMTLLGTHTTSVGRAAGLADEVRATAGATGTRGWNGTVIGSRGYNLALRPAAGVTGSWTYGFEVSVGG